MGVILSAHEYITATQEAEVALRELATPAMVVAYLRRRHCFGVVSNAAALAHYRLTVGGMRRSSILSDSQKRLLDSDAVHTFLYPPPRYSET
jgi:hypothetical protein